MANTYVLLLQEDMNMFIYVHQVFKSTNLSSGAKRNISKIVTETYLF